MPESAQKMIHELTAAGLLSSAEITKFDEEIAVGVEALMERLVKDGRITQYQADKFLNGQSSDIYFGDYVVMEELGRGGMGTVLLAKHRRMDREVAIKILSVTTLDSESAVARFYQEVKVAAQLTHANIVHAYDAGEHHGFHYLVMEYVRGHDLAHVLEQLGPIPVNLALDYITQAAKGLEYAHRKGVVHRDIKPSNLLLDDEGKVKILDMGLARLGKGIGGAEASMHLTTTGQVMGTVEYMSPEQAEDTRVADSRSDIYSLGCTLYRLVTGQAPFARDTVVKTIIAHREAPIPALSSARNPVLAHIDPLFRRLVAKNPVDRIQSATLLIQELRRLTEETDFDLSSEVVDAGIEIVERGSSPSDFPTVFRSGDRTPEIEYAPQTAASSSTNPSSPAITSAGVSSAATAGNSNPYAAPASPPDSSPMLLTGKPHRGITILTLGILSLIFTVPCLIGAALGIVTWIYANNDLREMREGIRDPDGRTLTYSGRILSIISCVLGTIFILASIFSQ